MHPQKRPRSTKKVSFNPNINDDNLDDDDDEVELDVMQEQFEGEEERPEENFDEKGGKIDPFNLSDERELGFFDSSGAFVWRKNQEEDAWITGLDTLETKEKIQKAAEAKAIKDAKEADESPEEELTTVEYLDQVLEILHDEETILKGLHRLGKFAKKPQQKKHSNKKTKIDVEEVEDDETSKKLRGQFEILTEAANKLLSFGLFDIYDLNKEEITNKCNKLSYEKSIDSLALSKRQAEEKESQGKITLWEYKGVQGQIHGPYRTSEILTWMTSGYFIGETVVQMRAVQSNSNELDLLNDWDDDVSDGEEKENFVNKKIDQSGLFIWQRSDKIDFSFILSNS